LPLESFKNNNLFFIDIKEDLNMVETERPLDALNQARGKRVIVELKNKLQLIGNLKAFDIHINTVLAEAEEWENGEMKRKLGTTFVRGDTIVLISPA
jgi:small nuclear ribonucleoprotein